MSPRQARGDRANEPVWLDKVLLGGRGGTVQEEGEKWKQGLPNTFARKSIGNDLHEAVSFHQPKMWGVRRRKTRGLSMRCPTKRCLGDSPDKS